MTVREISTRAEYMIAQKQGFIPLVDPRFHLALPVRKEMQQELFGKGHTPAENSKFYRWAWQHKISYCEECGRYLPVYSAENISHILTRGAHPAMAHDPRNVNKLCAACHAKWENGNKQEMAIYEKNVRIARLLKKEYYKQ